MPYLRRLVLCAAALAPVSCDVPLEVPAVAHLCTAGGSCSCSGFLVNPTTTVTARHCADNLNRVVFNAGTADEATFDVVRRCEHDLSDPECAALEHTDIELLFLDEPVPPEVTVPVRVGTAEDRMNADALFAAGYAPGTLETAEYTPGAVRDCFSVGYESAFPGESLCIASSPTTFPDGNSGGPLLAATADGELSAVGLYHGFHADYDQFQDLSHYADRIPGTRRPPFLDLRPWRWQCAFDISDFVPLMIATSFRMADFDGDGADDAFFAMEGGEAQLFLGAELEPFQTGPLSDVPVHPSTLATGTWAEGVGLAGVDAELRLRTFALEGAEWIPTPLPDVDLLQYDPLWGVGDLDALEEGQVDLETDPLLRPGDLDGDGQTDIVAVLSESLLVLTNQGEAWSTVAVPLADLGIPNAQPYRETITLADVDPSVPGSEIIARDECGLVVYGVEGEDLFETYRQPCSEDPWVVGDLQGYDQDNRWAIATGNLDGDACDDIMVRSATGVYQLLSSCNPQLPLELSPGPDVGASWFAPFSGYAGWGEGRFGGRLLLADLDGDGLDDLIGNGPHGMQARGNMNDEPQDGVAFASIAGLDPEHLGMVEPFAPVEDWATLRPTDFGTGNRQLISLSATLGCLRLFWL